MHPETVLQTPIPARPSRALLWVFAGTLFLGAFLLFQVQLIISKHILPWFGGSAAVWTTSMLVFETLLLGSPPSAMPQAEPRLWTDDYSNIFQLIY